VKPADLWRRLLRVLVLAQRLERGLRYPLGEDLGLVPGTIVAVPATNEVLYRIVGRSLPRLRDFQSPRERDQDPWQDAAFVDQLSVSMFDSEQRAVENAVKYPKLVAQVVLRPGFGFSLARTEADIHGHYCVWGDPEVLLRCAGPTSRYDESR
jgi:hypothetical protein